MDAIAIIKEDDGLAVFETTLDEIKALMPDQECDRTLFYILYRANKPYLKLLPNFNFMKLEDFDDWVFPIGSDFIKNEYDYVQNLAAFNGDVPNLHIRFSVHNGSPRVMMIDNLSDDVDGVINDIELERAHEVSEGVAI
jgi:hypothetical protein